MGEGFCVSLLVIICFVIIYSSLFLPSDVISSQELKKIVTLRKMEYEKSDRPFPGCFTKSEDVHIRTERRTRI